MDHESQFTTRYSQINKMAFEKYKSPETPVWDYIRDIWSSQSSNVNVINKNTINDKPRNDDTKERITHLGGSGNTDFMENLIIIEKRVNSLQESIRTLSIKMKELQAKCKKTDNQEVKKTLETLSMTLNSLKEIDMRNKNLFNNIVESGNDLSKRLSVLSSIKSKIIQLNKRKMKHSVKIKSKLFSQMEKIAVDIKKKQMNSINDQLFSMLKFHRSKDI